jgi:hypothetical protein
VYEIIACLWHILWTNLFSINLQSLDASDHLELGTVQLCFSPSKDESLDNRCYPFSRRGNFSCSEGCTFGPRDWGIFTVFVRKINASYGLGIVVNNQWQYPLLMVNLRNHHVHILNCSFPPSWFHHCCRNIRYDKIVFFVTVILLEYFDIMNRLIPILIHAVEFYFIFWRALWYILVERKCLNSNCNT